MDFFAYLFKRLVALRGGKGALPHDYEIPTGFAPSFHIAIVALYVFRPFLHPERDIGFGHRRILATMPVPEATANVDDCLRLGDDDVRPALKTFVADPVAPSERE